MKSRNQRVSYSPSKYNLYQLLAMKKAEDLKALKKSLPKEVTFLSFTRNSGGEHVAYRVNKKDFKVSFPQDPKQADYDRLKTIILNDLYESERS